MPPHLLLGIDLGTTVLKLCAFRAGTGELVGAAVRRLPVRRLPAGGAETRVPSVDRALRDAVTELRTAVGASWGRVEGIGLAAQGGSSILADRSTGHPHTPMVLWNDGRALAHAARLERRTPRSVWRRRVLSEVPPAGLGRLVWLKETHPKLFRADVIHIGAGEYLFFRLTGTWRQDAGNAIQIGSYNAAKAKLDGALLELAGVPLSFFAPLRKGHETVPLSATGARRLGLPSGIPVAGPYIDQEAGYLSAVGVSRSPLQCSLGTAWVGNFVLPKGLRGRSPVQLVIPSPAGHGRLVVLPLLTGNVFWEWGLEKLMGWRPDEALQQANKVLSNSSEMAPGLVALPWITQSNPLRPDVVGAGAFLGLGPGTDRIEMFRALAASLVFELARVFEGVKDAGVLDGIVLSGGASRARFFRALITVLFDPLPVFHSCGETSAAARGALYAFGTKATTVRTRRVRKPPRHKDVLRLYSLYVSAFEKNVGALPAAAAYTIRGSKR